MIDTHFFNDRLTVSFGVLFYVNVAIIATIRQCLCWKIANYCVLNLKALLPKEFILFDYLNCIANYVNILYHPALLHIQGE